MKKSIVCAFLLSYMTSFSYSQTNNNKYQIGIWKNFSECAITYTFDDNLPYQYTKAVPALDELGYKGTFYTVTNWHYDVNTLNQMAEKGHEIGSHTVTHPFLNQLSDSLQNIELLNSKLTIDHIIFNSKCLTIAYPYCVPSFPQLTSKYYIAARHCQQYIESQTPADFFNISSIICGSQGQVKTDDDFKKIIDETIEKKGWCVFLIHDLDDGSGYSPLSTSVFKSSLNYCKSKNNLVWVETLVNVVKYIKERDAAKVYDVFTKDSIIVSVSDTLDNDVYHYPLTIRRKLPKSWKSAIGFLNGVPFDLKYVSIDNKIYLEFDIRPDIDTIVLKKGKNKIKV